MKSLDQVLRDNHSDRNYNYRDVRCAMVEYAHELTTEKAEQIQALATERDGLREQIQFVTEERNNYKSEMEKISKELRRIFEHQKYLNQKV